MKSHHRFAFFSTLLLAVSHSAVCAPTPLPAPSSAKSLFQDRQFGPRPPPTPTPERKPIELAEEEPIPNSWWIGGIAAAVLAVGAIVFGTVRASRSSNLFGRQYRFPAGGVAALRLGGTRSGGHMATIRFGEGLPPSKTEDT